MPSTTNKGYSVQSTGSNSGSWGAGAAYSLNEGMIQIVDTNLAGVTTLSLSSTNVALNQTQANNGMLRLTGTLTANLFISPDSGVLMNGVYFWENATSGNFSVTFQIPLIGNLILPQSRRGVMWLDGTNGPRMLAVVGLTDADVIPAGTVMPFYQNAAPAGWTINSSLNDYALKIVSSAGGVTSGSVNYSTLFGRTATDGHALTSAELAGHTHVATAAGPPRHGSGGTNVGTAFYGADGDVGGTTASTSTLTTSSTGSGVAHDHDIDMRVKTASFIIASKN